MSCTTDWELERKPGGAWTYDEQGLTYNDSLFDGFVVYYEALGEATIWTFEDPIDGCNDTDTPFTFQDGSEYTFQDGTAYTFN